jgi:Ca-activated chloride channel family protein
MLQKSVTNSPVREERGVRLNNSLFIRDLVLTLLAAVFTGLSGSILLILLVICWGSAAADGLGEPSADLHLRSLDGQLQQQAPLLKSDVQIDISGILARVRVEHLFHNPSQSWMEGSAQAVGPVDAHAGGAEAESRARFGLESTLSHDI